VAPDRSGIGFGPTIAPLTFSFDLIAEMVGEHPTQTTLPDSEFKPVWRAACLAYVIVDSARRTMRRQICKMKPGRAVGRDR
jgi:hypothetical protein